MIKRTLLPDRVERYVSQTIARETPVQARLHEETAKMRNAGMQIGADQAAFLALLVRAIGARRAIEIGTFTGYSALAVASALPPDGRLICCDINAEWTAIGRRYWQEAGVADRIDLRLAPALETLSRLLDEGEAGRLDFAFVDADKTGYDAYYEACLRLLRPGGLMAIDNMLWDGRVADDSVQDADTVALRALNLKVRDDERVDRVLLTVGDGVMLVRKR